MVAPAAKGIIIAASVLVAAGLALYENPQVRQWVDVNRRKLALALHSLGDEINPPSRSRSNSEEESPEQRRRRREELVRRNRLELVRRAQAEGVAVDLDELAAIGREQQPRRARDNASFDTLVGSDGTLRDPPEASSSAMPRRDETVRRRRTSSSRGFQAGAAYANPFSDEAGAVLFDHDEQQQETGTTQPAHEQSRESRESTATLPAEEAPLIDTTVPDPAISIPELQIPSMEGTQQFHQQPIDLLSHEPTSNADSSFYSADSGAHADEEDVHHVSRNMTPTDGGFSTSASMAGTNDDIAVLSSAHGSVAGEHESHADAASDAGWTEHSFSEVGVSTPGSWTDVDSDDESLLEGQAH